MRIDYNEIFRHSYWICFISNSSTVRLWIIDGQLVGISSVASGRLPFIFGLLPVHLSVFRVYQICPHRIQMAEYLKWLLSPVQTINFYSIHSTLIIFASMWIVNKSIFTLNQVATLFHTNTHTHTVPCYFVLDFHFDSLLTEEFTQKYMQVYSASKVMNSNNKIRYFVAKKSFGLYFFHSVWWIWTASQTIDGCCWSEKRGFIKYKNREKNSTCKTFLCSVFVYNELSAWPSFENAIWILRSSFFAAAITSFHHFIVHRSPFAVCRCCVYHVY